MKFGLCESATYQSKSSNMAADRAINCFPEPIESGTGKNRFGLYGTPGLQSFAEVEDTVALPSRGQFTIPFSYPTTERSFAVLGENLVEIFSDGTSNIIGSVSDDTFPVYFAFNGTQLAIASSQQLWIFNTDTDTLTGPVLDSEGENLAPITVVFLAERFLINKAGTDRIYYSELLDGLTWDALSFFTAEDNPDRALVLLVDHDLLWAFGDATIQPFQTSPDPDEPFVAYQGGVIQQGCGAPASVVQLDNAFMFLGKDPVRGGVVAWRADGSRLTRISNHSVEQFWETYSRTDDAWAFAFVMQGHPFWQITFKEADWTWRYDASTNMWHEALCWHTEDANWHAHRALTHTYAFGKHLVGSR